MQFKKKKKIKLKTWCDVDEHSGRRAREDRWNILFKLTRCRKKGPFFRAACINPPPPPPIPSLHHYLHPWGRTSTSDQSTATSPSHCTSHFNRGSMAGHQRRRPLDGPWLSHSCRRLMKGKVPISEYSSWLSCQELNERIPTLSGISPSARERMSAIPKLWSNSFINNKKKAFTTGGSGAGVHCGCGAASNRQLGFVRTLQSFRRSLLLPVHSVTNPPPPPRFTNTFISVTVTSSAKLKKHMHLQHFIQEYDTK